MLVNIGLAASDADALAGLLAVDADYIVADIDEQIAANQSATIAQILVAMIDRQERLLTALGLFETWQRRLAAYMDDRDEWLARDEEYRLEGAWRHESMTRGQRWLVRVTCRIRRIDLSGHLARGAAADWLETNSANLNYREFVV